MSYLERDGPTQRYGTGLYHGPFILHAKHTSRGKNHARANPNQTHIVYELRR